LSVINDVLDISKIEANKLELSQIEFSVERMLEKITDIINFRIDEKQQDFNINLDKKIPFFVIGDDHRLTQVIMNLLSNAVKFSFEHGQIGLDVSLLNEKNGICEIQISVSDNGIGIHPEQQARLFNAFTQADHGISRAFGGTGLGLSISRHIVNLMDGEIWVESEIGKGSKFTFTVKVKRSNKNITSMLDPQIKPENMHILVVDDELEICGYFEDLFAQLGIKCSTVTDSFEVYRTDKEQMLYNMYFIDWNMPGMDGIELTKKINTYNKNKPVILMISTADWSLIKDMETNAGVSRYLLKPLFSTAIIDCINEYFIMDGKEKEIINDVGGRYAGKKILLAEDMEINREIIISLLEDTGVNIDCAENGLEVVEMTAGDPDKYDLILMDVQMPKMDGLEATRQIRAMISESLPIIAMTAHVFISDIEGCFSAGMNDHIGKPFDINDVLKILDKYLIKR
jgi:CheY-like chemotaxis protein/two-component sensor histidine kinase